MSAMSIVSSPPTLQPPPYDGPELSPYESESTPASPPPEYGSTGDFQLLPAVGYVQVIASQLPQRVGMYNAVAPPEPPKGIFTRALYELTLPHPAPKPLREAYLLAFMVLLVLWALAAFMGFLFFFALDPLMVPVAAAMLSGAGASSLAVFWRLRRVMLDSLWVREEDWVSV
ncbi:MAG: hypothetical protein Q9227_004800 [Pyrenula ochraceoflavens]